MLMVACGNVYNGVMVVVMIEVMVFNLLSVASLLPETVKAFNIKRFFKFVLPLILPLILF